MHRVRVEAPARLHLGMLAVAGDGARRFGGLGVSVGRPAVVLEAEPAGELSAEAHVLRDRLDDAQMRAAREPQRGAAAAGERQRPLCVGAFGGELVGRLRLEHDRRTAD